MDNTIWIFNPGGDSLPPCKWANYINYMPDSDYVQMMGLTGYEANNQETNKSFETIYNDIFKKNEPFFKEWPCIISEFGCGSGSDNQYADSQAEWVKGMFDALEVGKFPNIKAAVWFNGNDYNSDGSVQNRYALKTGNDKTMKAFKDGFSRTQP